MDHLVVLDLACGMAWDSTHTTTSSPGCELSLFLHCGDQVLTAPMAVAEDEADQRVVDYLSLSDGSRVDIREVLHEHPEQALGLTVH